MHTVCLCAKQLTDGGPLWVWESCVSVLLPDNKRQVIICDINMHDTPGHNAQYLHLHHVCINSETGSLAKVTKNTGISDTTRLKRLTSQGRSQTSIKLHRVYTSVSVTPSFPDRFSRINRVCLSKIVTSRLR